VRRPAHPAVRHHAPEQGSVVPPPRSDRVGWRAMTTHPTLEPPAAGTTRRRRTRLGVMGGTFDPVHHGHLVAASEVASLFGLDEVVFVPTGEPWQKSERRVSAAEDRYLM